MKQKKRQAGYTLAELLVVMAILAMVTAVSFPLIKPKPDRIELKSIAMQIAAQMRVARSEAIAGNKETTFSINIETGQYWVIQNRKKSLPADISRSLLSAREEKIEADIGRIRFFSDGGSTGGKLVLKRKEIVLSLAVDWLTGAVTVE